MYVISLSNVSMKLNFKQITRVELKCVQYSEGFMKCCLPYMSHLPRVLLSNGQYDLCITRNMVRHRLILCRHWQLDGGLRGLYWQVKGSQMRHHQWDHFSAMEIDLSKN